MPMTSTLSMWARWQRPATGSTRCRWDAVATPSTPPSTIMMSLFCLPCGKFAFAQRFANANF